MRWGARDRVAVVLFDEEAEIVQTLSADKAGALAAIAKAKAGSRGTHFAAAMRSARRSDCRRSGEGVMRS